MSPFYSTLFFAFVGILLSDCCRCAPQSNNPCGLQDNTIVLFKDKDYNGACQHQELPKLGSSECVKVDGEIKNMVTSVQFKVPCVQLCQDEHCLKGCKELRENTPELSEDLSNIVRSLKWCN